MRLKTFTAPTMAEAMEQVRRELGDDAIIVSTQRASGGADVRVSAALEETDLDHDIAELFSGADEPTAVAEDVRRALTGHGVPESLIDQITHVIRKQDGREVFDACVKAFRSGFVFSPMPRESHPKPILLCGPAGVGKSMTVAKLAARAVIDRRSVKVISADSVRAGAMEQLQAFAEILDIEVIKARTPESLSRTLDKLAGRQDLVFVDSPGLNPYSDYDMHYLETMLGGIDVEPVLVLAAGGDAYETAEIAKRFARLGIQRMICTRLDTTRRLGSLLSAAAAAELAFADVSTAPHVANGLEPMSAEALARFILPEEDLPAADAPDEEDPRQDLYTLNTEAVL